MAFEPDYCKFYITVSANGETTGEAVIRGKKITEEILSLLNDKIGIDIKTITLKNEHTAEQYSSQKGISYIFEKKFYFCCKADNHITEAITDLITDINGISYHIEYKLKNIHEKEQSVISEAVNDSREKAEKLARALNCKIKGFEEINCSADRFRDAYEFSDILKPLCDNGKKSLATELQNKKIEISKTVEIMWLTD